MQLKTITTALLVAGAAAFLAIGTATPSFAAKKKAAAAAEPSNVFCFQQQKPVCATRGGMKMTYASACFAQRDGATVVADRACGAKKVAKKKARKAKK